MRVVELTAKTWPALEKLENKNRAGEYYLTDVVALTKSKVETMAVEDPDEILGINDRRQLAEAEGIMRERIRDVVQADVHEVREQHRDDREAAAGIEEQDATARRNDPDRCVVEPRLASRKHWKAGCSDR